MPQPRRPLNGFPPDTRVTISHVTWEDYERFCDVTREGENLRIAFDGKDIEILTTGPYHKTLKGRLDALLRGFGSNSRHRPSDDADRRRPAAQFVSAGRSVAAVTEPVGWLRPGSGSRLGRLLQDTTSISPNARKNPSEQSVFFSPLRDFFDTLTSHKARAGGHEQAV